MSFLILLDLLLKLVINFIQQTIAILCHSLMDFMCFNLQIWILINLLLVDNKRVNFTTRRPHCILFWSDFLSSNNKYILIKQITWQQSHISHIYLTPHDITLSRWCFKRCKNLFQHEIFPICKRQPFCQVGATFSLNRPQVLQLSMSEPDLRWGGQMFEKAPKLTQMYDKAMVGRLR